MLKNDQCWRCDVSCKSPTPKVCCSRCEVAYYCSETCKNRDLFRHQVDCQTATLKRTCSGCSKESSRLKQCGSCLQAWYCNQACLKKSWPAHKASCQKMTRNTREMSLNIKKLHDLVEFTPGTATVYYWGNIPAQDLIKFPLNEGSEYSKPISVLACGVGDPRNIVLSVSKLPEVYQEELTFVLNDICACTLARTILLLYMIFKGGEEAASSVTQIWYSLRLSEDDYKLVINALEELIQTSSLEELTGDTMRMEQNQLKEVTHVWRTWLDLSSRKEKWISEARRRRFDNPQAKEGMKLHLAEIPKEHKKSASDWFANGILSSKESRGALFFENFTLTGSVYQISRNRGPFSYIIQSSVSPFASWDYNDVCRVSRAPSILKMYSEYVGQVLKKCSVRLATRQVKFHFLLCNCMEITPFLPPDRKYDRVTTSNIADFVPLGTLLDTLLPHMNLNNPLSVIITEFQNWVQFTDWQFKAAKFACDLTRGDNFRKKVLEDTKSHAIAYSDARQAFVEYQDHSVEFITFLRAALVASEVPFQSNRKLTWSSVADYNGLIVRNFLRFQNRVFPAKWLLNCRQVTMLNGFERAVEWIVKPS